MKIEIHNLSKSFGDNKVLQGVSLSIERNKSTIILGKSGCGKSVLLKLIYQLIQIDDGHILYDEKKDVDIDKFGMLFSPISRRPMCHGYFGPASHRLDDFLRVVASLDAVLATSPPPRSTDPRGLGCTFRNYVTLKFAEIET